MPVGDVLPEVPDEVEADAVPVPVGVLVTVGEMIVGVVVEEDEVQGADPLRAAVAQPQDRPSTEPTKSKKFPAS